MENQIKIQEVLTTEKTKTGKIRELLKLGLERTEVFKILKNGAIKVNHGEIQNVFKKLYPEQVKSRANRTPVRYQIRRNCAIFGNVISTDIEEHLAKLSEAQDGNFTATKAKKQTIEIPISELAKGKKSAIWQVLIQ